MSQSDVARKDSRVHRLPAECKIFAAAVFVFAVVATPREAFWAFGVQAIVVLFVAVAAQLKLLRLARRMAVELPFVAFAVFLPIVGRPPRTEVLGFLELSVPGLWGAWNILVKGTLGVAASAVLISTTTVPELLAGLERLRVPRALLIVASFMIRYGALLTDDLRRLHVARLARGDNPRFLWQIRAIARTAGALFVRAYERGERVFVAMLARGYGQQEVERERPARRGWAVAAIPPGVAVLAAAAAAVAG